MASEKEHADFKLLSLNVRGICFAKKRKVLLCSETSINISHVFLKDSTVKVEEYNGKVSFPFHTVLITPME